MSLLEPFFLRSLAAAIGVAVVAGPLGCFIVWQRLAYFGASMAHSALLGIALGIALGFSVTIGIVFACAVLAALLLALQRYRGLASDTLLGILAHASLALGIVTLSFLDTVRGDLLSYLFGDVLAVRGRDLVWIYGGGAAVLAVLAYIWRPLLALTVHENLARAEGVNVTPLRFVFMLTIAVVIAIAMKIVGILLIISLLIIPAATARRFARTPEQMALLAAGTGALAALGGFAGSLAWDTPTGPSIVVAATLLFALGFLATPAEKAQDN